MIENTNEIHQMNNHHHILMISNSQNQAEAFNGAGDRSSMKLYSVN